ncbi:alpha/beta fold hydrolase [Halotia wernerae UHCC 0503]|nr:alpha/beta fold hydrolase [Halotia wernerae UHCC 0503]
MAPRAQIVFLPGLLCDARVFAAQTRALAPFADTKVADFTDAASITRMAEIALAAFDGPVTIVGFSMGGRAALEAVRLAPQRVERLVLMDTGAHPGSEKEIPGRLAVIELAHKEGMKALAAKWLPPMLHPARETDPALIAPLSEIVVGMTPAIHERQIRALMGRPDARPMLPRIACPTLVMVGRQDRWATLEQHEALAAAIPGSRLSVIEDAGHFACFERPEAVNAALLDFLGFA